MVKFEYADVGSVPGGAGRQLQVWVLDDGVAWRIQQDRREHWRLLLAIARSISRAAGLRPESLLSLYHDDKFNLLRVLEAADQGAPVTVHVWQSEFLLGNGPHHRASLELLDELMALVQTPSLLKHHAMYFYFSRRDFERWVALHARDRDLAVRRLFEGVA